MPTNGTAKDGRGIFYSWIILGVASIAVVLGYAIRNTFAFLVHGLASQLARTLVDRFKPRLALPLEGLIAGVSVILCSLATAQWQFFLFYGGITAIGLSL
jgi:hypothetical protein